VRVAALLDEFSANSFSSSFHGFDVLPDRWREQFECHRPQVFMCESAWSGRDSKVRPWKGRVYASRNLPGENRGILLDILAHCRKEGIPTVFWNKEDPTHYTDRVHDFVSTASEFDHVFTTAIECVPRYRADFGLHSVHALPFAANPALFNPIEAAPRSEAVTFAGGWYANHVDRSETMRRILRGFRDGGRELEIYDRFYGSEDCLHQWPEEYAPFLRPPVPHDEVALIYKRSRFALNINTVTASRTMFARRVFELMASNTLVLSNHSIGVEEMFGRDVVFCDREPYRFGTMTDAEIDAIRERNLNLVLKKHSYRHRWEEILTAISFSFRPAMDAVTVVWPLSRREDASRALDWLHLEADLSQDRLLLLALDDMPPLEVARLYEDHNRFQVATTSLRHAEDLQIEGAYAPIETDHLLLVAPEGLPSAGWLKMARGHLQYADDFALTPTKRNYSRFRMQSWTGTPHNLLLSRKGLLALSRGSPLPRLLPI
jgi:spore maturation protein CgeB